jgi:hypothetical protein
MQRIWTHTDRYTRTDTHGQTHPVHMLAIQFPMGDAQYAGLVHSCTHRHKDTDTDTKTQTQTHFPSLRTPTTSCSCSTPSGRCKGEEACEHLCCAPSSWQGPTLHPGRIVAPCSPSPRIDPLFSRASPCARRVSRGVQGRVSRAEHSGAPHTGAQGRDCSRC